MEKNISSDKIIYVSYEDGSVYLHTYDKSNEVGNKNNQNICSKIHIVYPRLKLNLLSNIMKLTELDSAKIFFNVLSLHSLYIHKVQLNKNDMLKYILLPEIVLDNKISVVLETEWEIIKRRKVNEITNKKIYNDSIITMYVKEKSTVFELSNYTQECILSYEFPKDLSVICSNEESHENRTILNNFNRKTKTFNLYRKYQNKQIIPYIDETHLEGYKNFNETFIHNVYENNIEINLTHPYDQEIIDTFRSSSFFIKC